MTSTAAASCPLCGQADQSQSVAAITASHTSHTTSYGTTLGVAWGVELMPVAARNTTHGVTQSPLAAMVDLPRPLSRRAPSISITVLTLCFTVIVIAVVITLNQSPADTLFVLMSGLLFLAWPIGISAILILIYWRRHRRWQKDFTRWQSAGPIWRALQYCHRDHIVYDQAGAYIPPEHTAQYCYEQTQHHGAKPTDPQEN